MNELITQLDRLIKRLEGCHRLLHDDEMISDEEIAALIKARDLVAEHKPKNQKPSDPPNLFNYPGGHSPS